MGGMLHRLIFFVGEVLSEMIIEVNYVYDFTMTSALSALDGIYTVDSVLSYSDMLAQNLDLYALTYKPNNLTQAQFNTDLPTIRTERIIKMTSVLPAATVQYIPEHFFSEVPDGSVQKYYHLGLAIDLGTFADPTQLSALRSDIEDTVQAMAGVSNKTLVYTVNNQWMTTAAYDAINTARKAAISRVSNNFTDKIALANQVSTLKTLIAYYEAALKAAI